MAYILDTHALIFFSEGDHQLPETVQELIKNGKSMVSMATLWEISIKHSLGKLPLAGEFSDLPELLKLNSIQILNFSFQDFVEYSNLPLIHRDPFDRILVAQSIRTGFPVITKDAEICKYTIETLW